MMKVLIFTMVSIFSLGQSWAETYYPFTENGKVGLKDEQGNITIPARYDDLGWSNHPFSLVSQVTGYKMNGLWGILHINNTKITNAEFTLLNPAEGDYLLAYKRSTATRSLGGCLSTSGKTVIPLQYDGILINSLRAIVYKKSGEKYLYGLLDLSNKVILPVEFKSISPAGLLRYSVNNFSDRVALYNESGSPLTGFIFDKIEPFKKNYSVITQNGYQGVLNREGKIIVPCTYENISINNDTIVATKSNTWAILDGQNNVLSKMVADTIISLGNNLFSIKQNNRYHLANAQFAKVSSETFDAIGLFQQNKAIVRQGEKTGVISSNGSLLIPCEYHHIEYDKNYVLASTLPGHWVLLDSLGNRKTEKTYQKIHLFNGVYFAAKNRDYYGAINAEGKEVISCVYDSIVQYKAGKLVVKFRGAYGIIDLNEDWIVPPEKNQYHLVSTDRYLVKKQNITFLKSFDGSNIYFTENNITPYEDHLIETISTGGLWKLDLDGRIISRQLPPQEPFEYIFPESEGLRGIKKNGQYGFVDDEGRLRIANRYEGIKPFQERLAAIRILGKWGFIDHDEKLVIQPVHDETTDFKDGIAIVTQKNQCGLINNKGQVILPLRYDHVTRLTTKRFLLDTKGLKGLADNDGRQIVAPKYDSVVDINNGYIIVGRNGKYGLITTQGISTIPLVYDLILYDNFNSRYLALTKGQEQPLTIPGNGISPKD